MKTTKRGTYTFVESPVLKDLAKELSKGKWVLKELRFGRVNRMRVVRKKK